MVKIPGTTIDADFIPTPIGSYPPLFYSTASSHGNMLSVNAGNSSGLYVGGGGINKGFGHALKHQDISQYAVRHTALLAKARKGGSSDMEAYSNEDPTVFSMIDMSHVIPNKNSGNPSGENDGICFVDIFGKNTSGSLCPHGVAQNTGMLYACPPYGGNYADDTAFLNAVGQMGANCASSIGEYNKAATGQGQPLISVMRLCLFSSGIYNTNDVDKGKIALSIFNGMTKVLVKDDCGLTRVEMPYSADPKDPMFAAVKAKIDP